MPWSKTPLVGSASSSLASPPGSGAPGTHNLSKAPTFTHTHRHHDGVSRPPTLRCGPAVPVRSALGPDGHDLGPVPQREGCSGLQSPALSQPNPPIW